MMMVKRGCAVSHDACRQPNAPSNHSHNLMLYSLAPIAGALHALHLLPIQSPILHLHYTTLYYTTHYTHTHRSVRVGTTASATPRRCIRPKPRTFQAPVNTDASEAAPPFCQFAKFPCFIVASPKGQILYGGSESIVVLRMTGMNRSGARE